MGSNYIPLSIKHEVFGIDGIEEPIPEGAKVLLDIAVPPPEVVPIDGAESFLIQSQPQSQYGTHRRIGSGLVPRRVFSVAMKGSTPRMHRSSTALAQ